MPSRRINEIPHLIEDTNKIFEQEIHVPVSADWDARIENAYTGCGRATVIFDYRRWQAKQIGFQEINLREVCEDLMGSKYTDFHKGGEEEKSVFDCIYNHHNDRQEKKRWHRLPTYWTRMTRSSLFSWPPLAPKMEWQVGLLKLNDVHEEIPYGVVLRILEAKALKIFNCFHVLHPLDVGNGSIPKPIFLATMWEMPPKRDGSGKYTFTTTGYECHFFLSHWCPE